MAPVVTIAEVNLILDVDGNVTILLTETTVVVVVTGVTVVVAYHQKTTNVSDETRMLMSPLGVKKKKTNDYVTLLE
jgi:hypothetical protein